MGQITSVEARMEEIKERLLPAARQRMRDLSPAAVTEHEAGIQQGSALALLHAATDHMLQLTNEICALRRYIGAHRRAQLFMPKVPEPTPPWEEVEAALSEAEPSTPEGSGAPVRSWRDGSSNESAVPAGDTHLSEAARLLPSWAGLAAPGLRWRQGHEDAQAWAPT